MELPGLWSEVLDFLEVQLHLYQWLSGTILFHYVVYKDSSASNGAVVKKFDGISWVNVGGGFTGTADYTSIAIDGNNVLLCNL